MAISQSSQTQPPTYQMVHNLSSELQYMFITCIVLAILSFGATLVAAALGAGVLATAFLGAMCIASVAAMMAIAFIERPKERISCPDQQSIEEVYSEVPLLFRKHKREEALPRDPKELSPLLKDYHP